MSATPANDQPDSNPAAAPASDSFPAVPPAPGAQPAQPAPAAPAAPVASAAPLPPENLVRGLLLSLLTIPAGIVVFSVIYNLGFIASIVALGVAFAAFFLYRLGSGGRVSMRGAVVVALVTIVTLVLAFVVAQYTVIAVALGDVWGMSWFEVLTNPQFPSVAGEILADPSVSGELAGDAVFTFIFGLLGCGAILFNIFRAARAEQKAAPTAPEAPPAG